MTTRRELIDRLGAAVGAEHVLWRREDLMVYGFDGTIEKQTPHAVVFPKGAAEVARVITICNELGLPVTPRGAGTGLSGGAVPTRRGVVVATARMRAIVEIDPVGALKHNNLHAIIAARVHAKTSST